MNFNIYVRFKMPRLSYFKYVTNNEEHLQKSDECACIACFKTFDPNEITEWAEDFDENKMIVGSAVCPYCSVDTVVPNYCVKYTKDDLLMWHKEAFGSLFNKNI